MVPASLDLADIAAEQWGLVTTAQAHALGVSAQAVARLANQGAIERTTHGVYRVTGAPPSPLDDLRAAWLALDPKRRAGERLRDEATAVVSHRSAAAVHKLGDLDADTFEFTSATRKQTRRQDVRIHRAPVAPDEWTVVDGLPVTTVVRTVADLAHSHIDGGHLASIVRDALTRQHVDDQHLAAALRRHAHRYGAKMGDGEAVLARFLRESGVPVSVGRAVELSGSRSFSPAAIEELGIPTLLQRLREQLDSHQRAMTPRPSVLRQLAQQQAALADLMQRLQSPVMQKLATQHPEVAELSRLARRFGELVATPDPEFEEQENGE